MNTPDKADKLEKKDRSMINKEIWRQIEGFPDYRVSSFGRVKLLRTKELMLKPYKNALGHRVVAVRKAKKHYNATPIFRLLEKAFADRPDVLEKFKPMRRNELHGLKKHPLYDTWCAMKYRCDDPKNPGYKDYGGRGISVHLSWYNIHNFIRDMGPKPSPKHSIDRINNDGNYEPGNCRWATQKQQVANSRPRKKKSEQYDLSRKDKAE